MKSVRTCLVIVTIINFIGLISVSVFNILMDPYLLFRLIDSEKPVHLASKAYLTKAVGIIHEKPNTILLGSSIVDNGFYLPGSGKIFYDTYFNEKKLPLQSIIKPYLPIYNAGISGGGIYEVFSYLQHAYNNNPNLKHVIIGLEWTMFTTINDHNPHVPQIPVLGKTYVPIPFYIEHFLSRTVTYDSYLTLAHNSVDVAQLENTIKTKFIFLAAAQAEQMVKISPKAVTQGQDHIVQARDFSETSILYFSLWFGAGLRERLKSNGPKSLVNPDALDILQKIINFSKEKNIKLDIYVSPQSGLFWRAAKRFGVYPYFEQWLRELVKITPYWDFSGSIDFSKNIEKFFDSDALHFNQSAGEVILPAILKGIQNPNRGITYVTVKNVESFINKRHKELENHINNDEYFQEIFSRLNPSDMSGNLDTIFPIPYEPTYKNYRIFKFMKKFIALLANQAPYDFRRVLSGHYDNMLIGESLDEVMAKIDQ